VAINRDKVLEAAQKYVEKKKYDKAVQEYQKLIDADPNDARTLLKIGDLQAKQGLHAEAISTYETVGKLYAHQGFALKAIAVYKQIREIIAKHVPQLEERYGHITPKLAELYQQLGLTSDALAALDEVATRLQRQQKDPEAIEVFRKIVELDPTNPLPHLRLAEALSRVKDTDGAVFEFKTAASQLAGIGRRDDALKVLERLLHHKPDSEQARICAELYLSRGQPQDGMQALSKLQICFQANPRDFDTLSLLARAFNAIGQGAKAIEVQKEMARVARDAGKQDLFREIVERLLRVAPQDDGVRKLSTQSGHGGSATGSAAPAYGSAAVQGVPPGTGSAPQLPQLHNDAPARGYQGQQPPPYGQQGYAQQQQQGGYGQPQGQYGQPPPPPPPMPRPNTNAAFQSNAYGAQSAPQPQTLPRPITAAQFPPSPPPDEADLDEVEELSYEEVDAQEVLDEVQQAEAYEEGQAYEEQQQQQGGYAEAADPNAAYGESDAYGTAEANAYGEAAPEQLEAAPDTTEQIHKVLADANAFRRVRLYNKALDTLRNGLDIDPRSMDIHEVYRDILIESGQTEDAVQEMLVIAALYIDSLDGDSAARALQDVLAFDPQNARAIEMLQELGYEIVDENEQVGEGGAVEQVEGGYEELPEEHHEPLPSYDLEEMQASDVSPQYADERQVFVGSSRRSPSQAPGQVHGEELPSFPLDEPDAGYAEADAVEEIDDDQILARGTSTERPGEDHDNDRTGYFQGQPGAPLPRISDQPKRAPSVAPAAGAGIAAASSRELEDALDEAEFFCSRGLLDDARAILHEQLTKHPNNPLLRERIAELDAQDEQRGSGARERPRDENSGGGDRAYDIAASLDALESLDYNGIQPAEGHANTEQQVDVEEVFAKFKEGVAKQISVDDSDSHYNLGIAYKEMMLIDDAIREFEVAAQDPKRECVCRSMIGMVELERGHLNEAIDAFLMGLNSPNKDPQQETVLCYELGAAYEAKKMNKDALSYYQKAMRRDPNYRDVQERVRRLAKNEPKMQQRQAAVGADDEFDRAFDDLVSKA
jgi:tetratricopeptide (TPR) repeat protein